MLQTLFTIPREVAGVPMFGCGWLLAIWAVASVGFIFYRVRQHGWNAETRGYLPTLAVGGAAIAFLLPLLMDETGLPIRGYGVMLLVSVGSAVALGLFRAWQKGFDQELILTLAFWLFISGIVGARLFYIIEYWSKFQKDTLRETVLWMINVTQGGLVVYGSLLAGGLALVIFVYKYRLPGLFLSDLVAPSVVLGVGLGRIGCFLNGCCYGGACELPWAVTFPYGSPVYMEQVQKKDLFLHGLKLRGKPRDPPMIDAVQPGSPAESKGLRPGDRVIAVNDSLVETVEDAELQLLRVAGAGATLKITVEGDPPRLIGWTLSGPPPRSLPVHPAQLYSLIDALLLCFFLIAYDPYRRREGELTALTLTIHPISRFLLEIVRVDESPVWGTPFSISQNVSLGLLAGAAVLWIYLLQKKRGWGLEARGLAKTAVA